MEPSTGSLPAPALAAADPPGLLAAPAAEVARPAYALRFALAGAPGAVALQRVETRVRLTRGGAPVVELHLVDWEYFAFGPDPAEPRVDVHDFDARRDGWAPASLARLLRRHGVRAPDGPARLEVTKRFAFGAGALAGAAPSHATPGGGAFGRLAEGEGEPARARVTLGAEGVEATGDAARAPRALAGRGRWLDGPRLVAAERLVYDPATLTGRVERAGYAPGPVPGAVDSGPAC